MIQKILLAGSGTGNSVEMLKNLLALPALQGSSVTVLHVIPQKTSDREMGAKSEEGEKIMTETVQTLNLREDKISTKLLQGDPKTEVCKVADEINADLIVMGSRGLNRLRAILQNSVSQYVFQLTNRPMLLVKDDIYVKKLRRVAIALDKTDAAKYCLDLALYLLRDYSDAELILVRVNPDLDPKLLPLSKEETENNPTIAEALPKVKRSGVNYRCVVTAGRPGEELCKVAEEYNIDLLILGSPDRRPSIAKSLPDLDRLLGTSLSDYVRVNATCPILLARQESA
ncbi:universal stress protein [Oscillatoria sp. FACHB-1406]|uniref:universal stress protein n=1 Tax=Oscillatoria sp. FACHB-1406 TaxID=2692846 RepID=UPI0016826008|nr:universal stress protein [Oscillatoria sp. FACHB-1406]MBD2579018.1 universal stress protein [Oscillatoria sp. FACHB-1406]